ncbi:MAG TPA: hypothetical protein VKD72_40090 [Gemmataceae bacterium]|nr:hypothetical protein [Gemmataceae bacterium]
MRGGPLSSPEIVKLLQPFVVTSWHGAGEKDMTDDVKEVFTKSGLKGTNVYALILDQEGRLAHGFTGLSGRGEGRSDYKVEITKGLARLKLLEEKAPEKLRPVVLPDLKGGADGAPAGVRLFVRHQERKPIVEVIPMNAAEWKTFTYPEKAREIEAKSLRDWLIQLYPPAIRAVDQRKPFKEITGSLELAPAGADKEGRYALLRGKVRLAKGDDTESAFEGTLEAVLTYRPDAPEVKSLHGVVEGDYLYRMRGTQRLPLKAAIESRPE